MTTLPDEQIDQHGQRVEHERVHVLTCVEFDVLFNLSAGDVNFDGVVGFNVRIRIANGSCVVRDQIWHLLGPHAQRFHFTQFVLDASIVERVTGETSCLWR